MHDGHLITLTYRLYVTDGGGGTLSSLSQTVEPSQMPMYKILDDMLQTPAFMRFGKETSALAFAMSSDNMGENAIKKSQADKYLGAIIGAFCLYEYAHNNSSAAQRLPEALKGVDLAFYAACQALGLKTKVYPIMKIHGSYGGISPKEHRATEGSSKRPQRHKCKFHRNGFATEKDVTVWLQSKGTAYNNNGSEYYGLDDVRPCP